ncbi:regulatory protein GemA [Pseudomonas sp. AN-1]|uniref:gp16 family protein n=1 Tax=Pseudomonas sp. AN-1 TaxID=3096605 RepID=UPI002A69D4A2|nr:regulatory protein GemA [Pseudomonas sp. AN-1]WPP47116.1 regulatory protein GemA [Pseudomonas sp. AN-1]
MNLRQANLAKIHIAKKALGMDDDIYRALLARVAGVTSAKDLGPRQVSAVLAEFQRLGWQPTSNPRAGRARPKLARSRQAVMSKVEALLAEAGRPWSYADSMAERMFRIARVEWLDDNQLTRLMQALIIDAGRHGRPTR